MTLLYLAVTKNLTDIVEILLTYEGIEVNKQSLFSPLYVAARAGYVEIVEALLKNTRIVFDSRARVNTTPFEIASLQLKCCKTDQGKAKYQAIMDALTVKADEVYEQRKSLPSPYSNLN